MAKKLITVLKDKIKNIPSHIARQFKEEFQGETWKSLLKNNIYIVLGAFVYAIGASFFTVRLNIISGGISSMAIMISNSVGGLHPDVYILILNWIIFVLSLFILGIKYSLKTLVFTIFNPLFIMMFTYIIDNFQVNIDGTMINILDITNLRDIVVNDYLTLSAEALGPIAYLTGSVLGGGIMGAGIGLTLIGGGSSGGTDLINVTVHKYFNVKIGTSSLVCDVVIILAGFFLNGFNFMATIVGIVGSVACSIMIDVVFSSKERSYLALIVTNKWYELNEYINRSIERGTTLIKGQGGYSRLDTMVVEVCFDRRDYTSMMRAVHKIDPDAFMTIMKAQEVMGYGFSRDIQRTKIIPPEEVQRQVEKASRRNKKNG